VPLLALLWPAPGPALDPSKAITQYVHQVWETDDGLPSNSVRTMVQTRDGYLWLGTQEGLARFDGVKFTVFDKRNTPAIRVSYVEILLEDRSGALWIGTNGGGLNRFAGGRFERFTSAEGLGNDVVTALYEDRHGALWVGTEGGGLSRRRNARWKTWRQKDGLPADRINAIAEDAAGNLWIATDGGLARLEGEKLLPLPTKDRLGEAAPTALYRDRQGVLWVGTEAGLRSLSGGSWTRHRSPEGLSRGAVTSILEDGDGSLWVGADGGGLHRLRQGVWSSYTTREGLSHDLVWCLLEDREGSLWIGSDSGGLNRLKDGSVTPYTRREGLSGDVIWTIYEDRQGFLWLGTYGQGLNRLRDGKVLVYTRRDGLADDIVWSVLEDRRGRIWAGTEKGLSRLENGRWRSYSKRDGLPHEPVTALTEDRSGRLWVGTAGGGLARLEGDRFQVFTTRDGLSSDFIRALHEDRQGFLWIGTYGGGVNRFRDGRFEAITTKQGLTTNIVFSFHEDPEGAMWIGTYGGGLNRWKDGRLHVFGTQHGLFDDAAFQILEDGRGRLWMSCNRGVFSVARSELEALARGEARSVSSISLGKEDGMPSQECNAGHPAGWRTRDGDLWFATVKGAAAIHPDRLRRNNRIPPVRVERVVVDDRVLDPNAPARLPPGKGRFEFHFTALSFLTPGRVRFRYRLEGFDSDWIEAQNRRVAYFTNIPPGDYRFRVIAANEDGVWNRQGASFAFHLAPTFYQAKWFLPACILLLILAGAWGFRRRVRGLEAREEELTRLVRERTRLLEKANERLLQMTTQDSLTEIANRRRFDEALAAEWRRGLRARSPLSILMIDIDFFKAFNDLYGHAAGDDCLRRVAQALDRSLRRAGDLVSRYGGEEFAIILPVIELGPAVSIAERLRSAVELMAIRHESSDAAAVVTISVGAATGVPGSFHSSSDLIAAADRALYAAKRTGRNRVCAEEVRASDDRQSGERAI
jgi:diguanylate cyclase (GGDEF)-like protein